MSTADPQQGHILETWTPEDEGSRPEVEAEGLPELEGWSEGPFPILNAFRDTSNVSSFLFLSEVKIGFRTKAPNRRKLLHQNSGEQEEDFSGRPPPCLPDPQIFHPSGVYSRQAPCLPVAMAMASEPGISSPDVRLLPQML